MGREKAFYALVGRRVRELRVAKGWDQHRLAVAAGYKRTTVTGIETGRDGPSFTAFIRIADALGTPPALLLIDPGRNASEAAYIAEHAPGYVVTPKAVRRARAQRDRR